MTRRGRNLILAGAPVVVAAAAVAVWKCRPTAGTVDLIDLVHREAPVPDRHHLGESELTLAATTYPDFRDWLVSVVMDPDRTRLVRGEAFGTLWDIEDDAVAKVVAEKLVGWLQTDQRWGPEEHLLRGQVGTGVVLRALLSDWPTGEVLRIVRKATPRWRSFLESQAARAPDSPTSAWPADQQAQLIARAKAVLELADSLQKAPLEQGADAPPEGP